MASLPMHDHPSGPNTESPQIDTIQESVLILRRTQDLVLPLCLPTGWAEESVPGAPTGFNATTQLTDPQSRRSHKILLSVQSGFEGDTSKALLMSDSIPLEGTWRASLYEGDALRASVPFDKSHIELDRAMGPGIYRVELEKDRRVVLKFAFDIRHYSLPEAFEEARRYLSERKYIRARAVLSDAAARYPENADVEDLLLMAETLANTDPAALEEEQAQLGVVRSKGASVARSGKLPKSAKAKFGERMASVFASRVLDPKQIPDELIRRIAQETASIILAQTLPLLNSQVEAASARDDLLLEAMGNINKRLDELDALRQVLSDRIDLVQREPGKNDDEKYEEVRRALESFGEELRRRNMRVADYSNYFAESLGSSCWDWLSGDVKKIFIESEDHFRHAASRPLEDAPDYTAGLLDLYRGFELLLNERLGQTTAGIGRMILADKATMQTVGRVLPRGLEITMRTNLENIFKKTVANKPQTIFEMTLQLHLGKNTQLAFGNDVKEILGRSPGPADNVQLVILNLITSEYRNGKLHLAPGSPHTFTSGEEMLALRKLVLGIDEGIEKIPVERIIEGINRTSWLPQRDTNKVIENVREGWDKFPGVVGVLWQALGSAAKTTAA